MKTLTFDKPIKNKVFWGAMLFLALGLGLWAVNAPKHSNQSQAAAGRNTGKPAAPQQTAQAINGLMVPEAQVERPFAIVIENHPDSRPQSGLSQADIIYEALAEGGITRFLGIFQTQKVNMIGPVRSARTYFNDWAQEIAAVYAHVGGNSDALADINAHDYPDIANADQYFNGNFFWRTANRKQPHNTYTSTDKMNALAANHGYAMTKNYQDYIFKDDAPAQAPDAATVNISFSTPQFAVKYLYNKATNLYKRYVAGRAAVDLGNGRQIAPKTIIVQIVRNWPTQTDTILSIDMGTHESGDAYVFQDGREVSGTWKYTAGRTRYYDKSGNEIALNRGQMFIEIVPPQFETALKWK